jgi:hypothetical protein
MIRETIITTQNSDGAVHIAPMGIHVCAEQLLIMPFQPSTTLSNILSSGQAIINYTDDGRVFAGCLTGPKNWPLSAADKLDGKRLTGALAHAELQLQRTEDDPQRPKLYCNVIHEVVHAPFLGFNRAQYSVLEAAILVSRLHLLPWQKIKTEIDYLSIGMDKTAGPHEHEAWDWLMQRIEEFQLKNPEIVASS